MALALRLGTAPCVNAAESGRPFVLRSYQGKAWLSKQKQYRSILLGVGSPMSYSLLTDAVNKQVKGFAAQQDALSSILMRFVESLEEIESRVEAIDHNNKDHKLLDLERQIENLAFNIQGHAGSGVSTSDEEAKGVTSPKSQEQVESPPSPPQKKGEKRKTLHPSGEYSVVSMQARNRWRWATKQIRVKRNLAKFSMAKMKVDSQQSVGARLDRLENRLGSVVEALSVFEAAKSETEKPLQKPDIRSEPELEVLLEPEAEPEPKPELEPAPTPEEKNEEENEDVPDTRIEDLEKLTQVQNEEIKSLREVIIGLKEEISEMKSETEKHDDAIKDGQEKSDQSAIEITSISDEVASLSNRIEKLAQAAAASGQDPSILHDHALEKAKDAMIKVGKNVDFILGQPNQSVDDSLLEDMKAIQEKLPLAAEELEEAEEDQYTLIMGKCLRLVRRLTEADLADPEKPLLQNLVCENGGGLRDMLERCIEDILKTMNTFAQTGRMQLDVYDIQDWVSGQRLNTKELQTIIDSLQSEVAMKAQQSALTKYAYREDLDILNNGVNKLMLDVDEMRDKLLAEIAAGKDKTADGAQRLQEVADGLGEAVRNCDQLKADVSGKAGAKETHAALSELGRNLNTVASNTFPKVDLEKHLAAKIDKVSQKILLIDEHAIKSINIPHFVVNP